MKVNSIFNRAGQLWKLQLVENGQIFLNVFVRKFIKVYR